MWAIAGALGCAADTPLTVGVQQQIDVVGVTTVEMPEFARVYAPGFKTGAEEGALMAMEVATHLTYGAWVLAPFGSGIVGVPLLGATIGGLVGAIQAPPDSEEERVARIVQDVIDRARIDEVLRGELVQALRRRTSVTRVERIDSIPKKGSPPPSVHALLEARLTQINVSGPWGISPSGALQLVAKTRLVRMDDRSEVFDRDFAANKETLIGFEGWEQGRGDEIDYTEGLRDALRGLAAQLADKVIDETWGPHPIEDGEDQAWRIASYVAPTARKIETERTYPTASDQIVEATLAYFERAEIDAPVIESKGGTAQRLVAEREIWSDATNFVDAGAFHRDQRFDRSVLTVLEFEVTLREEAEGMAVFLHLNATDPGRLALPNAKIVSTGVWEQSFFSFLEKALVSPADAPSPLSQ